MVEENHDEEAMATNSNNAKNRSYKKKKKKRSAVRRLFICSCNQKKKKDIQWEKAQESLILAQYGTNNRRPSSSAGSLAYFDAFDQFYRDKIEELSLNGSLAFFDMDEYGSDMDTFIEEKKESFRQSSRKVRFVGINLEASTKNASSLKAVDDDASVGSLDGFPGMLSIKQVDGVMKLKSLISDKEKAYKDMIDSFSELETEAFALCRFCRARDFEADEVVEMMSQHVEKWKSASEENFYPDIEEAVGAPLSVLLTQYPFLFMGNSKQGYPVCYFSAARISSEGLECITTVDRLVRLPWYIMMHQAKQIYIRAKENNPNFYRLEQITIINLKGISRSLFSSRNINILKLMNNVLEVFPEMLYRCIIINAPSFFSMCWSLVKRVLDKNTAKKIVVFSSEEKAKKYLLNLIDEKELACDYGGSNISTDKAILKQGKDRESVKSQFCELLHFSKKHKTISHTFTITSDETVDITIYTRCQNPLRFEILNEKNDIIKTIPVDFNIENGKVKAVNGEHSQSSKKSSKKNQDNADKENDPYSKMLVVAFDKAGTFILNGHIEASGHNSSHHDGHLLLVGDIRSK